MSQLNIKGLVENIRTRTNVYTPIIEAIVNSIDAIEQSGRVDGVIKVIVRRSNQKPLNLDGNALAEISSVEIIDNGVGFNEINRESFDTLYSDFKISRGGKGYGRFMFLKYFESVKIESTFKDEEKFWLRTFSFGSDKKIIDDEEVVLSKGVDTRTSLSLENIKDNNLDKKINTFARKILEKLLIYFINDKYICPKIIVKEADQLDEHSLIDFLSKENGEIQQVLTEEFSLKRDLVTKKFQVKIFKIFYPHNQKSKISLVAHNREVIETSLSEYVPEFADDFYEEFENEDKTKTRKDYIVKTYVMGDYLDENVSLERGDFKFSQQNSILYDFSQKEIEDKAAEITKKIFNEDVKTRVEKKKLKIENYIKEEAPWNKEYLGDIDISKIPYNLDNETIELEIHKAKFKQERAVKIQVREIIHSPNVKINESVNELIKKISKAEMSELAHYVSLRKVILGLFQKSLELGDDGKYSLEDAVHDIIFPRKHDSNSLEYSNHNLWIVDEKLNFTEYVSSDKPLNGGTSGRVDLLIFNKQMMFRGGDEAGNPITIFEFKRPQRDDFLNGSSKEDPVEQVIRYVHDIKEGKYKTPKGRDIYVSQNTPFYGFIVCDLTNKVKEWLFGTKEFKEMPDGKGWYRWFDNNNLYIEVISWDKLLQDAEMRNRVFFDKLGI
jgi:hypothetical protein